MLLFVFNCVCLCLSPVKCCVSIPADGARPYIRVHKAHQLHTRSHGLVPRITLLSYCTECVGVLPATCWRISWAVSNNPRCKRRHVWRAVENHGAARSQQTMQAC